MLIKEFFQFYNMDYTNCVFASEANMREEVKREALALKLGIDRPEPDRPLLLTILERSKWYFCWCFFWLFLLRDSVIDDCRNLWIKLLYIEISQLDCSFKNPYKIRTPFSCTSHYSLLSKSTWTTFLSLHSLFTWRLSVGCSSYRPNNSRFPWKKSRYRSVLSRPSYPKTVSGNLLGCFASFMFLLFSLFEVKKA